MKKSLMLLIAAGLVAVMTGCGGGSSSASKKAHAAAPEATQSEQGFDVAPEESATNVTYKSSATGDFPPAPPTSDLEDAQESANANL
jgi:ABC-type phosphate/phosphonate transport system substrate-binding protein